ncbi:MAG: N-6 DNA methylase [Fusobacterium mortiferum]|nr:N-6 DNA methylase [Fusobacterium mortiferum]
MIELGQVFTKKNIAEYMVKLFEVNKEALILDPCFGKGVFIDSCLKNGFKNIEGCELDSRLYEELKLKKPELKLYNKDFLTMDTTKKYDGIIMNPPYIRHEKIDDLKKYGITKNILRKNKIFCELPLTANIYMYFIIKSLEVLNDNGEMIVIFPSSWLKARSGEFFKQLLYSKCTLKKQIHIHGNLFEMDALVDVIILVLIKGKKKYISENINLKAIDNNITVVQYNKIDFEIDFEIKFDKYASIRRGLTTGFNEMFINPKISNKNNKNIFSIVANPKILQGYNTKSTLKDTVLIISEEEFLSEDVKSYISKFEEKIKKDKSPKALYEKIIKNKKWYILNKIDGTGFIFNYFVRNDMKFIDNTQAKMQIKDNFYIIYPKIKKELLFALLNNYYTYYQLEKVGKKYGAGLLKIQKYDFEDIKFIDVSKLTKAEYEELCQYSKELSSTGEKENICKITKILSKYSKIKYNEIYYLYNEIKKYRLGGNNGVKSC